jgi:hypothetical protein
MAMIDKLWLATLTKDKKDAGTDANRLNLTVNVDGEDLLDMDFTFMRASGGNLGPDKGWLSRAQASISDSNPLPTQIESSLLTNSSIRLGIRTDDAWAPEAILLLGNTEREVLPLAIETEVGNWLSTDPKEEKLTMPLRLVSPGSSTTLIHRVIFLCYTDSVGGTDKPVELQITAGGIPVLTQQIPDTKQDDFEEYTGNWYFLSLAAPFIRGDVISNGGVTLRVAGTDSWLPKMVFLYGLDTVSGRPNEVVRLVAIPDWTFGALSSQVPPVQLPVF